VRHIRVAVPVPQLEALTYAVPEGTVTPVIGARVLVPLGKRTVTGVVTGAVEHPPAGIAARNISDVLDAGAFVPEDVVSLLKEQVAEKLRVSNPRYLAKYDE